MNVINMNGRKNILNTIICTVNDVLITLRSFEIVLNFIRIFFTYNLYKDIIMSMRAIKGDRDTVQVRLRSRHLSHHKIILILSTLSR